MFADRAPVGNGAAQFGSCRRTGRSPFNVGVNAGAFGEVELNVDSVGVEEATMIFEREPEVHRGVGKDAGGGLEVEFEVREIPATDDKDDKQENDPDQSEREQGTIDAK